MVLHFSNGFSISKLHFSNGFPLQNYTFPIKFPNNFENIFTKKSSRPVSGGEEKSIKLHRDARTGGRHYKPVRSNL